MNIRGKKILLRAIEARDNPMLLEIINDEETESMVGGWSFPVSEKHQEDWTSGLKTETGTLRCTIDDNGTAVGVAMLTSIDYKNGNAEVHVKLALGAVRGKGYGADALSTIVGYAFSELRLKCVHARVSRNNLPSQGLFKKCGFEEEGVMRCRLYKRGAYIDVVSFSILNNS